MNALLQEALAVLGLTGAKAEFLQHNENLTFRVDEKYLLRIHKAATGLRVDHAATARQAELAFLRHLSTQGLHVQQPLAEAVLADGTMATLMTWLEGRTLTNNDLTETTCHAVGRMVARMHRAAEGFNHAHFKHYHADFYLRMADTLDCILGNRKIPSAACKAVARCIGRSSGIAVHADLSPSNILLTPSGLSPIDFSLCGMGHPMLDLGILIASLCTSAQMNAVCEGYGVVSMQEIEAGFAAGLLGCFALHPDWSKEPWFPDRLDRWEQQILRPVAEGTPMFNRDFTFINA